MSHADLKQTSVCKLSIIKTFLLKSRVCELGTQSFPFNTVIGDYYSTRGIVIYVAMATANIKNSLYTCSQFIYVADKDDSCEIVLLVSN